MRCGKKEARVVLIFSNLFDTTTISGKISSFSFILPFPSALFLWGGILRTEHRILNGDLPLSHVSESLYMCL